MVLARFNAVVQDNSGRATEAQIEVRRDRTGAGLAEVYEDRNGNIPLGNPFPTDSFGRFFFHAPGGVYRIQARVGTNLVAEWRYVAIGTAQEMDRDELLTEEELLEALEQYLPLSGGTLTGGLGFGAATASDPTDLSRHIALYSDSYGFSITSNMLNIVSNRDVNVLARYLLLNGIPVLDRDGNDARYVQGVGAGDHLIRGGTDSVPSLGLRLMTNVWVLDTQNNPRILVGPTSSNVSHLFRASAAGQSLVLRDHLNTARFRVNMDTGQITQMADPTAAGHGATKGYVDTVLETALGDYVDLTSEQTITGLKIFPGLGASAANARLRIGAGGSEGQAGINMGGGQALAFRDLVNGGAYGFLHSPIEPGLTNAASIVTRARGDERYVQRTEYEDPASRGVATSLWRMGQGGSGVVGTHDVPLVGSDGMYLHLLRAYDLNGYHAVTYYIRSSSYPFADSYDINLVAMGNGALGAVSSTGIDASEGTSHNTGQVVVQTRIPVNAYAKLEVNFTIYKDGEQKSWKIEIATFAHAEGEAETGYSTLLVKTERMR